MFCDSCDVPTWNTDTVPGDRYQLSGGNGNLQPWDTDLGGISRRSGGPLKKKERGEEGAPIAELYAIIAVFVSPYLPSLLTIFIPLQMFPGIEFLHILRNLQTPESPES